MPILVDLPLLFINKSIFAAKTPISLPLWLLVFLLKRNLKRELTVTYLKVKGLKVKLIFNKNIIKPGNNVEYIKKAVNAMAILYTKQEYNYKNNILTYLKASLN